MALYAAQNFTTQRIYVDGNTYMDCELINCVLVYGGGEPPKLQGCHLKGTILEFEGAALRTVALIGAILAPDSPLKDCLTYLPAHLRGA